MAHYIGMAGLHGRLPQTCEAYDNVKNAAEGLAQIHNLSKTRTAKLKRDRYLELNLERDGNEYCEIMECSCNEQHND